VALARALILNPRVLLLDEPLGSLDAKLRKALQIELKAIQEKVGITFVYVTHDQEEALTMSDRIAVMSEGRVIQVGPPREVYEAPATAYVADFLGVSNLMDASARDGRVRIGDFDLRAGQGDLGAAGSVKVVIRPERVRVEDGRVTGDNRIPGMVERTVYLGPTMQVLMRLPEGQLLQAMIPNRGEAEGFPQGASVTLHLPVDDLRVLEAGDGVEGSAGDEPAAVPAG
jgi:spermidine/putrescine transport system ATP-binding protein